MKEIIFGPAGLILFGAILSAIGALWAAQQKATFEHELRMKSEEIVRYVIGGDSFCYLAIGSIDSQSNVGILMTVAQGEHPIYDVNARIVDLQESEKIKNNLTLQTISQSETHINIGNMITGTASMIRQFPLGDSTERDFNIFFSARNGLYTQMLRLRKINNKWYSATKVEKNDKVVFEQIQEKYPRNEKGEVDWK